MEGNRQIAGLLWNMFSTWITRLSLLLWYYRVLYIRLVCQQRHEGQCCTLYSIQCTERDGVSWGARALSVPTFSRITSSQVCRIHWEQGCGFASCLSQFKWRLPLKEAYSSAPFPPYAFVLERLHQEWDHGDQYNAIKEKEKKKNTVFSYISSLILLLLWPCSLGTSQRGGRSGLLCLVAAFI